MLITKLDDAAAEKFSVSLLPVVIVDCVQLLLWLKLREALSPNVMEEYLPEYVPVKLRVSPLPAEIVAP